jgi:filamentous hemagglutinin family protein
MINMVTRRKTLNTLMLLLLPASTVGAEPALNALPGGATIVHGDASLSRQENTLLIEQQSDKAIIEWQNFDIGRDATVHFRQPGEQSSVLNRVNSLDASEIYGQLQANGQVVLVNPNGVVFGASARVDVGSLVVATLALEDRDFLNNDWRLSTTGKPGDIVNAGNIAADQVVMVAARMLNNGNISAGNGVVLASGDAVTITTDPAGLLAVDVSAADWQAAIDNKGVVDAGDGLVLIKTDVAQSFYQAQMSDMDKTAQAGVVYRDGESIRLVSNEGLIRGSDVVLDSGARGHSEISGDVTASNGGDIIVTGRSVLVESEARLTASGDDGGRILLGGSWQNTENIRQALHTVVESGSVLDASADSDGDGGMIVAWSDIKSRLAKTLVSGQLRAEGKGAGNIGGKIETSGAVLNVDGISVSTSDGLAAGGEWLLDPTEITIVAGSTDNNIDTALNPYFSTGSGSEVSVETIKTALEAGSDVTIETTTDGSGDIIWEAGADLSVTLSNDQTLTLRAADNIYFVPSSNGTYAGTDIEASGASLNLHFNPNRGADGKGGFYVTGNYWPGNPTHISHSFTTNGGDFLVFGGALFDDYAVGDATTSANRIGIRLDRATLTTGSGDILLKGMGGDNVGGNYTYTYAGIQLVETVMDTTAGNIQLLGSYNSRSQTNAGGTGIDGLSHASRRNRLQTVHGNIDITGYAYSPIDSSNFAGYKIGSSLISTDYGEIRIFGEAPVAWGNNRALGVYMNHTGATITSGIDGVAESGGDVFIRGLHHLGDTAAHTNISLGVTDFYVYGRGDLIMQSSGRLVFGGSTTQIMVDNDVKLLAQDIHLGSLRDPGTYGNVYNPGKLRVGGSFHAYYTRSKTSYAIHPTSFDVTQPQLNCAYGGLNAECATGNSIIEAEEIIPGHLAIIRSYDSSANSIYDLTETQRNDLLAKNDLLWQLDTATSQYVRVHETDLTTHITQHTTLPQSSMQNTQTLYLQTLNGSSAYGDAVSLGYTLVNAQGTEVDINALGLSVLGTIAYAGAPLMGDNVGAYDYRYGSGLILRHATDNYMLRPWSDDGSWTITPRELSLSDLTGTGKIYDGSSDAIVNYNTANLSGLLTGEDVQLSHTASFSDANAGTNKSITVQFQLSDGSNGLASNYSLADQSVLADIAPRDLTISGSVAQEKTYDGSTAATITAGTLSGLLPGDTLSVIVNGSYATANAGSDIAVSPSYQLLDGSTLASNYVLTNSESLTADIQPRLLDIEFTTLAKTWDGTDSIEVQALPSGLIAGENLTLAYDARLLQTDAGDQVPV